MFNKIKMPETVSLMNPFSSCFMRFNYILFLFLNILFSSHLYGEEPNPNKDKVKCKFHVKVIDQDHTFLSGDDVLNGVISDSTYNNVEVIERYFKEKSEFEKEKETYKKDIDKGSRYRKYKNSILTDINSRRSIGWPNFDCSKMTFGTFIDIPGVPGVGFPREQLNCAFASDTFRKSSYELIKAECQDPCHEEDWVEGWPDDVSGGKGNAGPAFPGSVPANMCSAGNNPSFGSLSAGSNQDLSPEPKRTCYSFDTCGQVPPPYQAVGTGLGALACGGDDDMKGFAPFCSCKSKRINTDGKTIDPSLMGGCCTAKEIKNCSGGTHCPTASGPLGQGNWHITCVPN